MIKRFSLFVLVMSFAFGAQRVIADDSVIVGGVGSDQAVLANSDLMDSATKHNLNILASEDKSTTNHVLEFDSTREVVDKKQATNHWENVATRWNLMRKVRIDRQTKVRIAPKQLGNSAGVGFKISWR